MRIVLRVSSSNPDWDGGCAFAVVELSEVLATLAQRRIAALREQKNIDPDIDEVYYWASCVECYFSPWTDLASIDQRVEGTSVALTEMLDELKVGEREVVAIPDSFQVPASQIAAVECEQMIVRKVCSRQHTGRNVAELVMWHSGREPALEKNRLLSNAT